MTINFAVDRLYETGWLPSAEMGLEKLPSGLRYPTVLTVLSEFKKAGLELSIKPHLMFGCCRAEWGPTAFSRAAGNSEFEQLTGTVVGSCEKEAAVFALAKLREQQMELRVSAAGAGAEAGAEAQMPFATA